MWRLASGFVKDELKPLQEKKGGGGQKAEIHFGH